MELIVYYIYGLQLLLENTYQGKKKCICRNYFPLTAARVLWRGTRRCYYCASVFPPPVESMFGLTALPLICRWPQISLQPTPSPFYRIPPSPPLQTTHAE